MIFSCGTAFFFAFAFFVRVRENQFCYEERVAQIRERVLKTLGRVDGAQSVEIRFPIFTDLHRGGTGFSPCK